MNEEKTFPRMMIVRNFETYSWREAEIVLEHKGIRYSESNGYLNSWKYAEEIETPEQPKKMRPMTHYEIFKELCGNVVFRFKNKPGFILSNWSTWNVCSQYEYCIITDLGTENEEWLELVKEVEA